MLNMNDEFWWLLFNLALLGVLVKFLQEVLI